MRTREEWERWYHRPDPWSYEGSDEDLLRTDILLGHLATGKFRHALDLGCGEGRLTNALRQVADRVTGYDISDTAIQRARARYPDIAFRQGDLLDVVRMPEVRDTPFDLIVAAEVLYYLQTDEERQQAMAGIAGLGVPTCLYYFSVIVTGASVGRRYFTHPEFMQMLSAHFDVVDRFPCAVELPALLDRAIIAMPFRKARLFVREKLIQSRDASAWKHAGYLAVKRTAGGQVASH